MGTWEMGTGSAAKRRCLYPFPPPDYLAAFTRHEFNKAAAFLWRTVDDLNRQIETAQPWKLLTASDPGPLREHLHRWLTELRRLAYWLGPLLPDASERILRTVSQRPVKASKPLFPRLG